VKRLLVFVLLLFCCNILKANFDLQSDLSQQSILSPQTNIDESPWQHYIGTGPSLAIAEDDEYIWVGGAGLSKISKSTNEVTLFTRSNSGLPDNAINAICVDRNGNKWIGTASGLVKYDGTNWYLFNSSNSALAYDYIYDIKEDGLGNLWIGTSLGLNKFNGGTNWTTYTKSDWNGRYDAVTKVAFDKNGIPWIVISYGGYLAKLEGGKWTLYEEGKSFLPFNIGAKTIAFDNENNLWIGGTYKSNIIKYDGTNATIYDVSNTGISFVGVQNIIVDDYNNKWITSSNGIIYYDNSNWSQSDLTNSGLSHQETYTILAAKNNFTYVSTLKGIDKFNGTGWTHINLGNKSELYSFSGECTEAPNGDIWINTYNGLTQISNGIWRYHDISYFDYFLSINRIKFDKTGVLWGATNFGLLRYDGTNWELFNKINSGMPDDHFFDLDIAQDNVIWCAGLKSIMKFDGLALSCQEFTNSNSGIFDAQFYNIAVDNDGVVYAASNKGFSVIKNGITTNYDSKNSPLPNFFYSQNIEIDKNNNIWIADRNNGAFKFKNDGTWEKFTMENSGIGINFIRYVYCDNKDNVWFVSQNGITKYDGTNWQNINTANSGIGTNICRTLLIDSHGNYWVGTYAGFSFHDATLLGIEEDNQTIPADFNLSQNYPNPFNPVTSINYQLSHESKINIKVFDILGIEVAELVNEIKDAGKHSINFDGSKLASGIYFYRISAGEFSQVKKMILLK